MKQFHGIGTSLAMAAALGTCLPVAAVADAASPSACAKGTAECARMAVRDVELSQDGLLVGQLLDDRMQPMAGSDVTIYFGGNPAATTRTDESGVFAVAGLRGGVHQVAAKDTVTTCRFWTPGTAPPHAMQNLRLLPGQDQVVRGQWGGAPMANGFHSLMTNPWVVGGVIAAAIAVPVALHNLDDDDDNGS